MESRLKNAILFGLICQCMIKKKEENILVPTGKLNWGFWKTYVGKHKVVLYTKMEPRF